MKPPMFMRIVAWFCQRIWPTEWAMQVSHTHPNSDKWLWKRPEKVVNAWGHPMEHKER